MLDTGLSRSTDLCLDLLQSKRMTCTAKVCPGSWNHCAAGKKEDVYVYDSATFAFRRPPMLRTTDTPRGERLVKMLVYLMRNRARTHSVRDIHAKLNEDEPVSLRNVQRDLRDLAVMRGCPVATHTQNGVLHYTIEPDMRDAVQLPIENNALLAFFVLRRMQPFFAPGSAAGKGMRNLLEELSSRSDEDLFEDFDERLGEAMHIFDGHSQLSTRPELFNDVFTALAERRVLEIEYQSSLDTGPAPRAIRPVRLALARGELYLLCISPHDEKKNYWIKVARIAEAKLTDKPFTVSPARLQRIDKRLRDSFGILDDDTPRPRTVMLHFPKYFGLVLQEKRFHHTQEVTRAPSGAMVLRMRVPVDTELVQWVLGWGDRVTVVAPDELKREVLRVGREFVRRYG